ncbi:MAG TPA: signal peptide peptidase SppA [Ignavibacteria bacterium]|nr:signal peptide peptidase SppA [Ignavibacteria bacterium]
MSNGYQQQYQQQPKKSSFWKWFWGITLFVLLICIIGLSVLFYVAINRISGGDGKDFYFEYSGSGKGKIAVVELDYTIITAEPIVRQFTKFRDDKSIQAIVLRINTPGGGVAASQEMYEIIKNTSEKKPVVVSMGSIGASGGYYAACGSSLIVANPGSLVGSIGVIANFISIKGLADDWGIKETTIKSGELKDAGNPFREPNAKDIAYFQDIVDNSFRQFFNVVKNARNLDSTELIKIANGRVFTGEQGIGLGLVDTLGTFEDAIKITADMVGIEGKPVLVRERERRNYFDLFYESMFKSELKEVKDELKTEFLEQPILQYKFVPSGINIP